MLEPSRAELFDQKLEPKSELSEPSLGSGATLFVSLLFWAFFLPGLWNCFYSQVFTFQKHILLKTHLLFLNSILCVKISKLSYCCRSASTQMVQSKLCMTTVAWRHVLLQDVFESKTRMEIWFTTQTQIIQMAVWQFKVAYNYKRKIPNFYVNLLTYFFYCFVRKPANFSTFWPISDKVMKFCQ